MPSLALIGCDVSALMNSKKPILSHLLACQSILFKYLSFFLQIFRSLREVFFTSWKAAPIYSFFFFPTSSSSSLSSFVPFSPSLRHFPFISSLLSSVKAPFDTKASRDLTRWAKEDAQKHDGVDGQRPTRKKKDFLENKLLSGYWYKCRGKKLRQSGKTSLLSFNFKCSTSLAGELGERVNGLFLFTHSASFIQGSHPPSCHYCHI